LKATRLNSFKVRLENFYAIYWGIFRKDLVFRQYPAMEVIQCTFNFTYGKTKNTYGKTAKKVFAQLTDM
jgi:hypothetical protein